MLPSDLPKIAQAVWNFQVPRVSDGVEGPTQSHLRWANHNAGEAVEILAANHAKVWAELGLAKAKFDAIKADVDTIKADIAAIKAAVIPPPS